ncbi:MAG: regulatory protein RecX [Gammaproteobacteria bacterium]
MQKACDFLARREHSRRELRQKLSRNCKDDELIEELLDKLSAEGLQSDARFAESFVQQRYNKGQGPLKIKQELNQRGIDTGLIADCLNADQLDWLALAEQTRVKKFGSDVPRDYQNKAKQSRFLYSRGFTSEQISLVLKE